MLYDMDVLEEQVLFRWHKSIPQGEEVPERERLRKQVSVRNLVTKELGVQKKIFKRVSIQHSQRFNCYMTEICPVNN